MASNVNASSSRVNRLYCFYCGDDLADVAQYKRSVSSVPKSIVMLWKELVNEVRTKKNYDVEVDDVDDQRPFVRLGHI